VAGHSRLKVGRPVRFAAVIALVLLAHSLALRWLQRELEPGLVLKPMANPMFTRLLTPQQPQPVATVPPPSPVRKRKRATVTTVAKAPDAEPAASAPAPEAAASAPQQETTAAAPPSPAASAPVAAASAPLAPASAPATPGLDSWPADTRLSYRLTGWYSGELHGSARVQWQRQQERYQTRIDIDLGLIGYTFLSQGEVAGEVLSPRAYEESTTGRSRIVQFGPEAVVINDGRTLPRPPRVQDTASQFVELSHRFSTGEEQLEVGRNVSVWLARPGGVDLWTYDIVDRELLRTPQLGVVEAFHLKPRPIVASRGNITAEMWFAPALQYLPVRIRVNMGTESFVDLVVDKIEQR
jgi:hypothetical protein